MLFGKSGTGAATVRSETTRVIALTNGVARNSVKIGSRNYFERHARESGMIRATPAELAGRENEETNDFFHRARSPVSILISSILCGIFLSLASAPRNGIFDETKQVKFLSNVPILFPFFFFFYFLLKEKSPNERENEIFIFTSSLSRGIIRRRARIYGLKTVS